MSQRAAVLRLRESFTWHFFTIRLSHIGVFMSPIPADFRSDLEIVWASDTAYDPALWAPEVPSTGHCAVTALIVNALFGGEILRFDLGDQGSHYANVVDGEYIDLTADQFDNFDPDDFPSEERSRDSLIMDDGTFRRFTLLCDRLKFLWESRRNFLKLVVNG